MDSLTQNQTWTLVRRSKASIILTNKWVLKKKDALPKERRRTITFRGRLAIRGFKQTHGVDYSETFPSIIKFTTLCLFLAVAATEDLNLQQTDNKSAFLSKNLGENVYIEQPEGFIDASSPDHVCELEKVLYCLKHALRQWFSKLNNFSIKELGFLAVSITHASTSTARRSLAASHFTCWWPTYCWQFFAQAYL